jgi:hypothetical protein
VSIKQLIGQHYIHEADKVMRQEKVSSETTHCGGYIRATNGVKR